MLVSRSRQALEEMAPECGAAGASCLVVVAVIQDYTAVEEMTPERRLVLKARGWPVGEARVVITLEPSGPDRCRVTMSEDVIKGPGALAPHPLRQVLIVPRNRESLYRVALLAEGQYRKGQLKES